MDRVGNLEREEGGKFQILPDLFLQLALVEVKKEEEKNSVLPLTKDGIKKW